MIGNDPSSCSTILTVLNVLDDLDGQIPGLSTEVKLIPMFVAVFLAGLLAHSDLAVIISGGVGKNGSTVAVS